MQKKSALLNYTKLNFLRIDYTVKLTLTTDASAIAVDATLQQISNDISQPISFFSAKLNPAQINHSTSRELLTI